MRFIEVDISKTVWKDGLLTIPTNTGYEITIPVTPIIGIAEEIAQNGQPMFDGSFHLGQMTLTEKPQQNPIKTQAELKKRLLKIPVLPDNIPYSDFLIGFIYGDQNSPDNFKWFLQLRSVDGAIFNSMIYANGADIKCPTSTMSWFDGGWHGRMMIKKGDLDKLTEITDQKTVEIYGKSCGGYPEGKKDILPESCDTISIRYNVTTNKWYADFIGDNLKLSTLEVDGISADVPMQAKTDRTFQKPKVTELVKVSDVASIYLIGGHLTILGK